MRAVPFSSTTPEPAWPSSRMTTSAWRMSARSEELLKPAESSCSTSISSPGMACSLPSPGAGVADVCSSI
jgi:hypothetical protein